MELLKDMIRQCYPLLVLCSCVLFVVHMFFGANLGNGKGIFERMGTLYTGILEEPPLEYGGLKHLETSNGGCLKSIHYNEGTRKVNDCIKFRSLFQVELQKDFQADMEQEYQVAIYLEDIKNLGESSVLERLTAEEIDRLEEIPAAFIYEEESDLLYFFRSGVFLVQIKVYGIDGSMERYEFYLPVDVM